MINIEHFSKVKWNQHLVIFRNMSKKSKAKGNKDFSTANVTTTKGPIKLDKDGNILIEVYAKPGAKQNIITDISDEGVNIQINAPPVEGAANTELVKYMASFLGLKSSNVSLERGQKSRNKVLKISGSLKMTDIIKKVNAEVPATSRLPEEG